VVQKHRRKADAELKPSKQRAIISIASYRKLAKDYISPDEKVIERLEFLEKFCRIVIRKGLESYASEIS